MASNLTMEKLLGFITPRDYPGTSKHISKDMYAVRKAILMKKLERITDNLKTNHWIKLTELVENLPSNITPIGFLVRVRKMKFSGGNADRNSDLIYSYMLDLYVISSYLRLIENNVENSIEYNEVKYED